MSQWDVQGLAQNVSWLPCFWNIGGTLRRPPVSVAGKKWHHDLECSSSGPTLQTFLSSWSHTSPVMLIAVRNVSMLGKILHMHITYVRNISCVLLSKFSSLNKIIVICITTISLAVMKSRPIPHCRFLFLLHLSHVTHLTKGFQKVKASSHLHVVPREQGTLFCSPV